MYERAPKKRVPAPNQAMTDADARNSDPSSAPDGPPAKAQEATCCIVGAGPAGMMLALLLRAQVSR